MKRVISLTLATMLAMTLPFASIWDATQPVEPEAAATTTTMARVFRLELPAAPTDVAVRITPPIQITPTLPPPTTALVGLKGMPFAPAGMTACDEMSWYRQQAGLPQRFDAIGYRESRCIQEPRVKTYCCYGWWQIYFTLHVDKLGPACEVYLVSDINGPEPLDKQKQACSAKLLFDLAGYSPWSLG